MARRKAVDEILEALVAFDSVVGTPNGQIVAWIEGYLSDHGVMVTVLPGPESDRANLFASIGGQDRPGLVLSGHLDVVPAGPGWQDDPFRLRRDQDRLIGRGAVDMKGFIAAALASVPDLVKMRLPCPIHLAFSYDEEIGCRGVPHLLDALPELCAPPFAAVIGEPTSLRPVQRHKGKAALRIYAKGKSGHSSRPDLGRNAIEALLPALIASVETGRRLASKGQKNRAFAPPYSTLQIGTIKGGLAINVIPEQATAEIEARCVPGEDPMEVLAEVTDAVAQDPALEVEVISTYPALELPDAAPLVRMTEHASGYKSLGAVSFGTEAGLYQQAGIPAIVCGPGSIDRAHKPEEYITVSELGAAQTMILALANHPLMQEREG